MIPDILHKFPFCLFLFLIFFSLFNTTLSAQENQNEYMSSLLDKADRLELTDKRYWHILLHYEKSLFGLKSQVDDPDFFLSPNGKDNPHAELHATIRSFFQEKIENGRHPSLRFIGRFNWLVQELDIDISRLPYNPMDDFEEIYADINPKSLYIIFPAGYIDSPASMFGHTLLLIERKNRPWLKSMTINYAAITDETFGPTFAVKGLAGSYKGYYSYLPYYKKIQEYNDIEMRDMWEYKFNFSENELRLLVMHMIELEKVYSYYYFLDENCSYNLLYLLEAARPELDLVGQFQHTCEPVDTLRAFVNQNAIESKSYRPSKHKKVLHLADKLSSRQIDYAISTAKGKTSLSEEKLNEIAPSTREKALMLDLSSEYCQYLLAKGDLTVPEYRSIFFSVLRQRNTIQYTENEFYDIYTPASPDHAHHSRKIGLGMGMEESALFSEFQFRMTSHNLMDDETGLNKNSQLIFGNTFVRYYPDESRILLHKFDLIDIDSIPQSNRFYLQRAIFVKTGIIREMVDEDRKRHTYYLNFGPGLSYGFPRLQWYGFPQLYGSFSKYFDYYSNAEAGFRTGLLAEFGISKTRIEGQYRTAPFINEHDMYLVKAEERIALNRNFYLGGEIMFSQEYNKKMLEYIVKLQYCFR